VPGLTAWIAASMSAVLPKSLLPWTRFVVDHATCKVLLV
jgi:hypothetical protein